MIAFVPAHRIENADWNKLSKLEVDGSVFVGAPIRLETIFVCKRPNMEIVVLPIHLRAKLPSSHDACPSAQPEIIKSIVFSISKQRSLPAAKLVH